MKVFIAVLLLNSFLISSGFSADAIVLHDAITQGLALVSFAGNSNSTHYQKPVSISLKNKTNSTLNIIIENGLMLEAVDSSFQNLVVVKSERIAVAPYANKQMLLQAMCIEKSGMPPADNKMYSILKPASGSLLELSQLIERKQYYNLGAQQAVWCLTDKMSLDEVTTWNFAERNDLLTFLSKATGQPIPPPPAVDDIKRNNNSVPVYETSIEGSFNYTVRNTSEVLIAMFDKENRVVRELYRNNEEPAGEKEFKFAFDSTVYTDSYYYIRLLVNGTMRIQGKVLNDER